MGLLDGFLLNERIEAFKPKKVKDDRSKRGEGIEDYSAISGYGSYGVSSFNQFYNRHINMVFESEKAKILAYRNMAMMPEIGDVIEDAVIEATQETETGEIFDLQINNSELKAKEAACVEIIKEFDKLFYQKLNIKQTIWDMFYTYMVDGRCYFEYLIDTNHRAKGICGIKKLPTETMDYEYDINNGSILAYYQYLTAKPKRPTSIDEANSDPNTIVFYPEQIGFVHNGIYGENRRQIIGYLEKAKQPYNQVRLLETSVVIYRIIRAPERYVFKIDTGNMPKDKAMKYVEKIKNKMMKKQSYDTQTGELMHEPEVFSMLENFFLPQSADGRGSDIDSIGGNPSGFAELDDLYYFQKKLYRSLKYPISRVNSMQDGTDKDNAFGATSVGEITRDEIKWARFLERQQNRFCNVFLDMFMKHLDFIGLKQKYNLEPDMFNLIMTSPNQYKDNMKQKLLETRFSNYNTLAGNPEFSKTFLMKRYLGWDEQDITDNKDGFAKDKKFIPNEEGTFGDLSTDFDEEPSTSADDFE